MASGKMEKTYIQFNDENAEKACAEKWGDGIGITEKQAKNVTSFSTYEFNNKEIQYFNELKYFEGITVIPQMLISNNPVVKVTIPVNVTDIQNYWFRNNQNNQNVRIILLPKNPPTLGWASFNGIPSDAIFYVPDDSLESYKTAATWSRLHIARFRTCGVDIFQ